MRMYDVISTNCDCGSGRIAILSGRHLKWGNHLKWVFGPKCPYCRKQLGQRQWAVLDSVKAEGEREALQKYRIVEEENKNEKNY